MTSLQRFGTSTAAVLALLPGSVEADLGGAAAIGEALDAATQRIAAALPAAAWQQLLWPQAELIVSSASAGQTTAQLGMAPVVAGSVHLWRRSGIGASALALEDEPQIGVAEESGFSVDAASGAISGIAALAVGERLYASYALDTQHASFAVPSLAALCARVALADLLGRTATAALPPGIGVAEQHLAALASGTVVLAELRARRWWPQHTLGGRPAHSISSGRC